MPVSRRRHHPNGAVGPQKPEALINSTADRRTREVGNFAPVLLGNFDPAFTPQARGLIEGLTGVGHVMADAAYDADHLRRFIADELGATAQIKQNPTRSTRTPIDWTLYKERHLVECFFNHIKRFRRIALRCEKTLSSFRAFVSLACAMAWLT